MKKWLKSKYYWFSNFQWYRKWYGGTWECWWTDLVYSKIWYNDLSINIYKGRPSVLARNFIKKEEWKGD